MQVGVQGVVKGDVSGRCRSQKVWPDKGERMIRKAMSDRVSPGPIIQHRWAENPPRGRGRRQEDPRANRQLTCDSVTSDAATH